MDPSKYASAANEITDAPRHLSLAAGHKAPPDPLVSAFWLRKGPDIFVLVCSTGPSWPPSVGPSNESEVFVGLSPFADESGSPW